VAVAAPMARPAPVMRMRMAGRLGQRLGHVSSSRPGYRPDSTASLPA
jgi:hypothetical protein